MKRFVVCSAGAVIAAGAIVAPMARLTAPLPPAFGESGPDPAGVLRSVRSEKLEDTPKSMQDMNVRMLDAALPLDVFRTGPGGQGSGDANRQAFRDLLDRATTWSSRVAGKNAVVECTIDGGPYQIPMRTGGLAWQVDAAQWFTLGKQVASRNGPKPARAVLVARDAQTQGYGSSGVSFIHVTQDADRCAGRIDAWYCWNGDLHFGEWCRATAVKQTALDNVKVIPAASPEDWKATVRAKAGQVYVARCRRTERYDFYVTLRVTAAAASSISIEWKLLAVGFGAPATISETQPYAGSDAAERPADLCARDPGPAQKPPK